MDTMLSSVVLFTLTAACFGLAQDTPECGSKDIALDAPTKEIIFPPNGKLTKAAKCVYLIKGSTGTRLSMEITEMKLDSMVKTDAATQCTTYYFKVADNETALAQSNQITCGTERPTFMLSGNIMAVELNGKMDDFVKATVTQEQLPKTECGEGNLVLMGDAKAVQFPVDTFKTDGECAYQINGEEGKKLSIQVNEMKLGAVNAPQSNSKCSDYYLKVAENDLALSTTTQVSCGDEKPKFSVSGNKMAIRVKGTAGDYVKATITQINIAQQLAIHWTCPLILLVWTVWKW